jgi:DNA-directed RNA polymerase specialized sigma24 family protein
MARDPDIERRLLNWARAKRGGLSGGLGYASVNLEAEGAQRGYREATIPVDACEADVMDAAVRALVPVLREVVTQFYLNNRGVRELAARERITPQAVKARIWKAHGELRAWLSDRSAKSAEERRRVEQLQRGGFTHFP